MSNLSLFAYSDEKKTPPLTADIATGAVPAAVIIESGVFQYRPLPPFLFVGGANVLNNVITMLPKYFSGEIDSIKCVICEPMKVSKIIHPGGGAISAAWGLDIGTTDGAAITPVANGIYENLINFFGEIDIAITGTLDNIKDQDPDTFYKELLTAVDAYPQPSGFMHWVTLIVPDFSVLDKYRLNDTKYNFDNIYLGMNIQLTEYSNASWYEGNQNASFLMGIDSMPIIGPRSHGGIVSSVFNQDQSSGTPQYQFFGLYFQPDSTGQTVLTIKNLPDSYYAANTPSTGDVAFLYNSVQGAETWGNITGYKNAALNPSNINAIRTLMSKLMIDLVMRLDDQATTLQSTIQINDLAWILEKSVTIQDAVYGNLQGRTFGGPGESLDVTGNVWNGRKSAPDMILGAIDMMEHLCRLQNWGEVSGNNAIAGKEYSPNAKINTASFDAILSADGHADGYGTMAPLSACCPAFQIEDKGDIKTWLKELCWTFYINRSQDNIGAECVVDCSGPGPGETVTPAVAISFADVNGTIGNIEEPDPRYIYCEPVIEYAYDYGAGKFGAVLGIVDATVSYATFALTPDAYLAGFKAVDMAVSGRFGTYASVGDYIWQQCNLLYQNYGNITTAPGELTDKKLISTYADALWCLRKWLWWMLTHQRRITVPTWYAKGAVGGVPVLPGTLVSVALPHLNEETPTLCRVETISRSLQKNLTQWGLIIIDEAVTIA